MTLDLFSPLKFSPFLAPWDLGNLEFQLFSVGFRSEMLIRCGGKNSGIGADFFSDAFPRTGTTLRGPFSADFSALPTQRFGIIPSNVVRPNLLRCWFFSAEAGCPFFGRQKTAPFFPSKYSKF